MQCCRFSYRYCSQLEVIPRACGCAGFFSRQVEGYEHFVDVVYVDGSPASASFSRLRSMVFYCVHCLRMACGESVSSSYNVWSGFLGLRCFKDCWF